MLTNQRKQNILEKVAARKITTEAAEGWATKQLARLSKRNKKVSDKQPVFAQKVRDLESSIAADPNNIRLRKKMVRLQKKIGRTFRKNDTRNIKTLGRIKAKKIMSGQGS